MAKNAPLGLVGIILLAASIVFIFFTILPGVSSSTPFRSTYFLRADTSGITGARAVTQWTYFHFCGSANTDCGSARAAPAFGKAWDSNADNVPPGLGGSHGDDTTSRKFFFLWRFGWVFFLISLFFQTIAFISAFLACCGRLGAAISSVLSLVALAMLSIAASLMTATFVEARNDFTDDGRDASLGRYAFGFVWASWACVFLATFCFCFGIRRDNKPPKTATTSTGSRWRWRRNRSVRSSRTYDGRRVKDDYS